MVCAERVHALRTHARCTGARRTGARYTGRGAQGEVAQGEVTPPHPDHAHTEGGARPGHPQADRAEAQHQRGLLLETDHGHRRLDAAGVGVAARPPVAFTQPAVCRHKQLGLHAWHKLGGRKM